VQVKSGGEMKIACQCHSMASKKASKQATHTRNNLLNKHQLILEFEISMEFRGINNLFIINFMWRRVFPDLQQCNKLQHLIDWYTIIIIIII